MRKIFVTLLLACALLAGISATAEEVRMLACSVGKADAILLQSGDSACLIDTGYTWSRGRILAAMAEMGITRLDAVIVTHTDSDHIGGLDWLARSDIEIGAWYASANHTCKKKKHPMVTAAALRDEEVVFAAEGDVIEAGSIRLEVLAPIGDTSDTENDNSLVLRMDTPQGALLLCGDMEYPEEELLLESGADVSCAVLKVANHADNDTGSKAFIKAASPKLAVISTSTEEKPATPDAKFVRRLENVGAEVLETQECTLGVLVRMGDTLSYEYLDAPETDAEVYLTDVDAADDTITLRNMGDADADLTDWYLVSIPDGELYVFPEGTALGGGAELTVGTYVTPDDAEPDLIWDSERVIRKKKADTVYLYDANGNLVFAMDNGL